MGVFVGNFGGIGWVLVGMRVVDGTLNDLVAGMGCFTECLEDASFDVVVVDAIGFIGGFVGGIFEDGVLDMVGSVGVGVGDFFEEEGVLNTVGLGGTGVSDFFEEELFDAVGLGGVGVGDFFEEEVLDTSGLGSRCGMEGDGWSYLELRPVVQCVQIRM